MSPVLVSSRRGKPKIIFNNFAFTIRKKTRTHHNWSCRVAGCQAKATTSPDPDRYLETFTMTFPTHSHDSPVDITRKKSLYNEMKTLVRNTESSNRTIINSVLRRKPESDIVLFDNVDTHTKYLRTYRCETLNPGPIVYPTLGLGESITTTHTNECF